MAIGIGYAKLLPIYYNWLGKRKNYQTGKKKEKLDKAMAKINSKNFAVFIIAGYIFSMFIWLGIVRGMKTTELISENDIEHSHELIFEDGESQKVKMLGKNSLYVFYISKEKPVVSISPIDGNIKVIKLIENKEEE